MYVHTLHYVVLIERQSLSSVAPLPALLCMYCFSSSLYACVCPCCTGSVPEEAAAVTVREEGEAEVEGSLLTVK